MSIIIVLPNGSDWFKANWVFRQLSEDICNRYRNDDDIRKTLDTAQALGSLDLKTMALELRCRMLAAIGTVVEETLSGAIAGWRPHDKNEHVLYCEAISELRELILEAEGRSEARH